MHSCMAAREALPSRRCTVSFGKLPVFAVLLVRILRDCKGLPSGARWYGACSEMIGFGFYAKEVPRNRTARA